MKRILAITLVVSMLLLISATALADTIYFINFTLENGVNGKQNSGTAKKSTATGTKFTVGVTSISGATSAGPMVCNVYNSSNTKVSKSSGSIYTTGSWARDYTGTNGADGIKDKYYYLKMQNTTGGPTIKVTGYLTP